MCACAIICKVLSKLGSIRQPYFRLSVLDILILNEPSASVKPVQNQGWIVFYPRPPHAWSQILDEVSKEGTEAIDLFPSTVEAEPVLL
jgi:hypothetical protein